MLWLSEKAKLETYASKQARPQKAFNKRSPQIDIERTRPSTKPVWTAITNWPVPRFYKVRLRAYRHGNVLTKPACLERNPDPQRRKKRLDLHGQRCKEAVAIAEEAIHKAVSEDQSRIDFVVGKVGPICFKFSHGSTNLFGRRACIRKETPYLGQPLSSLPQSASF